MNPDAANEDTNSAVLARMEIQRSLGRVEGKLDQILAGTIDHEARDTQRFTEVNKAIAILDTRNRSLERKIWYATGAVAVIAFSLSHFPFSLLFK